MLRFVRQILPLITLVAIAVAGHLAVAQPSEPFYNNDETRHVLTGVFFRDFYCELPLSDPVGFASRYYAQYQALGLLVWPPLFYVVEGLFMLLFGTSVVVARILVGLFAILACVYLYRLVQITHNMFCALLATALFVFSPLVFEYSQFVMLEIPALALCLASIFHFQRYLKSEKSWDAFLACGFAAMAGLTRYDGVFLIPYFLIALALQQRLAMLLRPVVLAAIATGLAFVIPYYVCVARMFGGVHISSMTHGTHAYSSTFLAARNWFYYPLCLPDQIGWTVLSLACVSLIVCLHRPSRSRLLPYLALSAAVYLTFTPMADLEPRHTIYWIPAFCLYAAEGLQSAGQWLKAPPVLCVVFAGFALSGTGLGAMHTPPKFVRGYEEAARYVVEHTSESPFCLFDNFLNGNFIYHVRLYDPQRRIWVLRADKLLYNYVYSPHIAYKEYARSRSEILGCIDKYDPEYIVIERPQLYFPESTHPISGLLRELLADEKDRFILEKVIPIESNHNIFRDAVLEIYRSRHRNPRRSNAMHLEILGLRRSIEVDVASFRKTGG